MAPKSVPCQVSESLARTRTDPARPPARPPARSQSWADETAEAGQSPRTPSRTPTSTLTEGLPRVRAEFPPRTESTDANGVTTIVEYRLNDQGKKVKVTRRIKRTLVKKQVNHVVAERMHWPKFGLEKGAPAGPSSTTTVGESVLLKIQAGGIKVRSHPRAPLSEALTDRQTPPESETAGGAPGGRDGGDAEATQGQKGHVSVLPGRPLYRALPVQGHPRRRPRRVGRGRRRGRRGRRSRRGRTRRRRLGRDRLAVRPAVDARRCETRPRRVDEGWPRQPRRVPDPACHEPERGRDRPGHVGALWPLRQPRQDQPVRASAVLPILLVPP